MARTKVHRPTGIKILVALGMLQGVILCISGSVFLIARNDADVASELELSGDMLSERALLVSGGTLIAIGVVHLVLSLALALRSSIARTIFGIAATVSTGASVFALIALREGREGSVPTLIVAVAVLWFLYGPDETQEYFAR